MEHRDLLYQRLLENPRYVRWLLGEAPEEEDYWREWAAGDPVRQEVMEQARLTILAIQGKPVTVSKQAIADQVRRALMEAKRQEAFATQRKGILRSLPGYGWAAAASVAVLLGVGWLTFSRNEAPAVSSPAHAQNAGTPALQPRDELRWVANLTSPARHVLLPDGSSVVLRPNSRVGYATVFRGDKREVYLSGEAFFEVTKDPAKPFFVYASGLVTKVLGTSFNVKARHQTGRVIVAVKTGRVAVFAQNDPKAARLRDDRALSGLVLMPNQQATFDRADARLTRTAVEAPVERQSFDYKSTPIAEVFASLEKAYGVTIRFDRELMAHCSLSATLGDEPLQKKIQWICAILEAQYQVQDQQITITGKACQ